MSAHNFWNKASQKYFAPNVVIVTLKGVAALFFYFILFFLFIIILHVQSTDTQIA